MILRDYQQETIDRVLDGMAEDRERMLVSLWTGSGKTVVFTELASRINGRTLVIAPMRELVFQATEKSHEITGEHADIEMGEYRANEIWPSKIVAASKQTLLSSRDGIPRYEKFRGFRLVIVDEAHMQASPAVIKMLDWFVRDGACVVGFTATPFRMDGRSLTKIYGECVMELGILDGIEMGYCCPPSAKVVTVPDLDLTGITIVGGDYNQTQLAERINRESVIQHIAFVTAKEMRGQTIVFTPGIAPSRAVAESLRSQYGISADYVCGNTAIQPDCERSEIIRKFRCGDLKVLVNCQVVSVGFDVPTSETIILARPTRSSVFFLQAVGRVTRPLPGAVDFTGSTAATRREGIAKSLKPNFRIIDLTPSTFDHRLLTSVDMFLRGDADLIATAKEIACTGVEKTLEELRIEAEEKILARKAAIEMADQRARMRGRANGSTLSDSVDLTVGVKRCVGTYKNPLRGKFSGVAMGDLPDHYIHWACDTITKGWMCNVFKRERSRRRAACGSS